MEHAPLPAQAAARGDEGQATIQDVLPKGAGADAEALGGFLGREQSRGAHLTSSRYASGGLWAFMGRLLLTCGALGLEPC